MADREPGRDSQSRLEVPGWGGGAEAGRPPDPTRPRQPGQRGRWRRGQRPEPSRVGVGQEGRPGPWQLAQQAPHWGGGRPRSGASSWGWSWLARAGSYSLWYLSILSLSLLSLALSFSLNPDLAPSAIGTPTPSGRGPRRHAWVQNSRLISSQGTTSLPTAGASPSAQDKGPQPNIGALLSTVEDGRRS